jgi:CBS domain-containing protein
VASDVPVVKVDLRLFHSLGFIPLVRRHSGRFIGAVSLRHLELERARFPFREMGALPTIDLATREDLPLFDAGMKMVRKAVRALPIVDRNGRFVSLVQDTDLLHRFSEK